MVTARDWVPTFPAMSRDQGLEGHDDRKGCDNLFENTDYRRNQHAKTEQDDQALEDVFHTIF